MSVTVGATFAGYAILVEYTPEIEAQKAAAEAATTAQMAALFAPLSQTQVEAIVTGTNALVAASANAAP
ncbi:MAG: hypothetical protein WBR28_01085 [Mycobacterium sp.]